MNDACFTKAVGDYRNMVFKVAYGYVKDVHDADDITQEVFLKLYKCDESFAADENMKAWLIRVCINASKSLLRTSWKSRRSDMNDIEQTASATLPAESLELYEYVRSLKPKYRTVIYLYYYEGYSTKEIAKILQITETAVSTQLGRARAQLKEFLMD